MCRSGGNGWNHCQSIGEYAKSETLGAVMETPLGVTRFDIFPDGAIVGGGAFDAPQKTPPQHIAGWFGNPSSKLVSFRSNDSG